MIELTRLENGCSAKIVELRGGRQFEARLNAMGIIPGVIIIKKSDSPMHGPVVLEKGATSLAIGYGMAQRVMVEPLKEQAASR